jgi:uncharacterized protein YndB with AHSA1/START domain
MWKKLLAAVVVLLAAFLGFAATRPSSFRVERSARVAAPPALVYGHVADFAGWQAWSPWASLDPAMKTELSGTPGAPGASYAWSGNKAVGQGRMTLKDARAPERLAIDLEFIEPFASRNLTTFTFAPEDGGTRVTWIMEGPASFVTKLMTTVKSMDAMVGPDFEKGLAALKGVAEAAARGTTATAR